MALLPAAVCPICSPAYAALLSSLGRGCIATTYLLPMTVGFLTVALGALGFRASSRRGLWPFAIGVAAAALVLGGKFWLGSSATTYLGVGLLGAASVWNAIPKRRTPEACTCLQTASGPQTE